MRVCPKCGYREPPYWRVLRYNSEIDYCHIEDFKEMQPELSEQLIKRKIVTDQYFAYKLAGKGKIHVHRIDKQLYDIAGKKAWHMPMEHVLSHTEFARARVKSRLQKQLFEKPKDV